MLRCSICRNEKYYAEMKDGEFIIPENPEFIENILAREMLDKFNEKMKFNVKNST